ncbi:MAG: APC family permease [Myxococcales bacterium]|nr:APC family permease [Myxococcales bacterium]
MIVVSLVIGMGIFRTPVNAAAGAGTEAIFFAAWTAAGVVALCGALTYAEIGSRYPITGGYFRIFAYAYHPSIAFSITSIILVSNAASAAGVALIGAEYLLPVLAPGAADPHALKVAIAGAALCAFFALNLLGLRTGARAQNLLTLIKLGLLAALIAALFLAAPLSAADSVPATPAPAPEPTSPLRAFGLALIATSFTYGGYQQTINFGSEVRDAARVVPRAIGLGLAIIISVYLLINLAYVHVIGFDALGGAESIAALLAGAAYGPAAGDALAILLFLSVLGYVNVAMLTNPRLLLAMSEDAALPGFLGRRSARGAPVAALTLFTALALVALFAAQTFDVILNYTMFLDSIGMATSAATIFVLRPRTSHLDGHGIYRMRLYPLLPLIFIAAYLFIAGSIALADPQAALRGLGIFAAFLAIGLVARARRRPTPA